MHSVLQRMSSKSIDISMLKVSIPLSSIFHSIIFFEDFLSDIPDKKSVLMYVMCLFQQLPSSTIVIEDKEKTATTMTNTEEDDTMETKVRGNISNEKQSNFLVSSSVSIGK